MLINRCAGFQFEQEFQRTTLYFKPIKIIFPENPIFLGDVITIEPKFIFLNYVTQEFTDFTDHCVLWKNRKGIYLNDTHLILILWTKKGSTCFISCWNAKGILFLISQILFPRQFLKLGPKILKLLTAL